MLLLKRCCVFSFPVFDVARMVLDDFLTQARTVNVGIDFGSGNAFMSEHGLDGAKVGSTFQQVGGK